MRKYQYTLRDCLLYKFFTRFREEDIDPVMNMRCFLILAKANKLLMQSYLLSASLTDIFADADSMSAGSRGNEKNRLNESSITQSNVDDLDIFFAANVVEKRYREERCQATELDIFAIA